MTQVFPTLKVSEDLLVALQRLSPAQYQQLVDFAQFLAQQEPISEVAVEEKKASDNWVDRVSGSFKDDPEFEEILRYGREYRELGCLKETGIQESA